MFKTAMSIQALCEVVAEAFVFACSPLPRIWDNYVSPLALGNISVPFILPFGHAICLCFTEGLPFFLVGENIVTNE